MISALLNISAAPQLMLIIITIALLLTSAGYAQNRLSLAPRWSFSPDLSFPSSSPASLVSSDVSSDNIAFLPILSSAAFASGSKGFSFGFLSFFPSPSSPPSLILLSICLGVSSNGPPTSSTPFLLPVWTPLNNTSPLTQSTQHQLVKLEVDDSRQLSLRDGDGSIVWTVSNVDSMELQSNGNLVIFDSNNQSLWHSFDHPSDSLLQGQRLRLGMELTSSNNMYKAKMEAGGILSYEVSRNPVRLVYWVFPGNTTVDESFADLVPAFSLDKDAAVNLTEAMVFPSCAEFNASRAYSVLDGALFVIQDACGNVNKGFNLTTSAHDLLRLDADGTIRDYYLQQLPNSSYVVTSSLADYQPCYTPNVCGAYGVCSVSNTFGSAVQHRCRCPSPEDNENFSNAFFAIDNSKPPEGCRRKVTLECGQVSSQSLVEIKNVAFMSMLPLFELTWEENTMSLEDCKAACSSNCTCSGFFYHSTSSFCLPFGDSTPLSNVSFLSLPSDEHFAYVKIQSAPARSKLFPVKITAAIVVPAIVIILVVCLIYWKWKQNLDPEAKLAEEELLGVLPVRPTRYSYQELRKFTQGFSKRLGSGGFGSVYEGVLPDGRRVAVKNLELLSHGQKEFLAEIATIGGISHVNIVSLYGFCLEKHHRLLVYEYMENSSLDRWIFGKGEQQPHVMSWETRFNVALGTARGLAYLHEECRKPILHFDVKPQNILLDGDLNPKLADFGLAKLVARGQSSVMTVVRGTPGYIAPEWVSQSIVSNKCDVYSFGMVLLELVSGRKNVETELMGSEDWYFPKWAAKKTREGKIADLVDKRLVKTVACDVNAFSDEDFDSLHEAGIMEQVKTAVRVALVCIQEDPEMRPSMTMVCGMLEGGIALPKDVPAVATTEMPAFKITSSGSVEVVKYSLIEGR